MKFIKELMNMPYHIKRKVLDRFYSAIMYTFLFFVLFPIVWMMYNSFMGNNDIVSGKVAIQRVPYNVLYNKIDGEILWVCTSDGSIYKYNYKTNRLLESKRFNTHNTNYGFEAAYIWMSSADKGLIKIRKSDLKDYKQVKIDWKEHLDFNKISKTMIAVDKARGKVLLTLGYQDFARVVELDSKTLKITKEYNLLDFFPFSYEKLSISAIYYTGGSLFVASNRGILELDLLKGEVLNVIENSDFSASEIRGIVYGSGKNVVYFASNNKIYTYDRKSKQFKSIFTTIKEDHVEQIVSIALVDDKILLGTGQGLILLDKQGKLVQEYNQPMFSDVDKKGRLIKEGRLINSDVTTIEKLNKDTVFIGTSAGRITQFDLKNKKVIKNILINKHGFLYVHWRNYFDLFKNIDFGLYLRNSFIVCGLTAFISMLIATITAYALVRFDFPGNRLISTAILSTQMIPGVMILIPIYIMFIKFTELTGIPAKGTFTGMVFVYSAFFLPFSIWILRGFFASIPVSLEEAATIDGCTPLQIFYKIALPLSWPGIVATGIFVFLVAWDEVIFAWQLSSAQTMTIPAGIRLFVGNFQNRYDLLMSASTVATIPVMIIFMLLQKQIVTGLTSGAVKE